MKIIFSFKDNIRGADLAGIQLMIKYNKEFRLLFYVLLVFIGNMRGLFL